MIISSSYFKGFLNVAVAIAPNSDLLGDDVLLNRYIAKYEPELLVKLLGYPLYKDLMTNIADTSGIWYELLNGKEYQVDGVDVKWQGLIFNDGETDRSLIANYIFYFYLLEKQKTLSGVGMVRSEATNATSANATQEANYAFNEFVDMVMIGNGLRSLYQFIQDMNDATADTYEDWYPSMFEYKNSLGL